MNDLKAMMESFGGKIKADEFEDSQESGDGAGMKSKFGCQAVILELPEESVAVFYSSILGEIRFSAGVIRFVYKTEDAEGVWVYHMVTITGGEKLFQVFRHLAAGRRESIKVAGTVTEIRIESSDA